MVTQLSNPRIAGIRRKALVSVGLFVACLLSLAWYVGLLGGNVRAVVPGSVYRSASLTGATLAGVLQDHGIRTVINLRGGSLHDAWYRSESAECASHGAKLVDIPMSAVHYPPPGTLRKLLETFDHAAYPVLFHCRGGSDRSGLVGTLYLAIYRHVPLDEAQKLQLTWRYGHLSFGEAHPMDDFLNLYRKSSSGSDLRSWILTRYAQLYNELPEQMKTPQSTTPGSAVASDSAPSAVGIGSYAAGK